MQKSSGENEWTDYGPVDNSYLDKRREVMFGNPLYFKLTGKDHHDATLMGQDTVRLCEMQGIVPRMKDKKGMDTRTKNNVLAFKAEFLFARLFNLPLPVVNVLSDGGIDFWLGETSVDVKCSSYTNGPLIFDAEQSFAADFAVLYGATDDPKILKLNGCIDKSTFFERAYKKDFGYGERFVMKADSLDPIEKLWRFYVEKNLTENSYEY
jgi:hypothetical protein